MKKIVALCFFTCISIWLTVVFFKGLTDQQFLFIGDQFFRFTYHEVFFNSFFIRKIEDLGLLNGWQFVVQFWDTLYYLLVYSLGIQYILAEKILFFLVLLLTLIFSFFGFLSLSLLFFKKEDYLTILTITLWYCFNPYVVILWHGGVYNLGSLLTYALAPLILYTVHRALFTVSSLKEKMICALLLMLASFTFWLFAPLVFLLGIYVFLVLLFTRKNFRLFLKNTLLLILFYVPMTLFIGYNILFEYFNNVGDINASFTPTFGNIGGGLWNQAMLLSSWGIYNIWNPRSLYSFFEHYSTTSYVTATIIMYGMIFIGIILYFFWMKSSMFISKNRLKQIPSQQVRTILRNAMKRSRSSFVGYLIGIFVFILLISLFLAKAAQPPYGEIFLFLYEKVPFFTVFRTPDIRFGFTVVLSIAVLLLAVSREWNKYLFSGILLTILWMQSSIFFTGTAITGENIPGKFYDRVIAYPKEYQEVIRAIPTTTGSASYVLPLPAVEYGNYTLQNSDHHFGQDILVKQITKPFLYLSLSKGMAVNSYSRLNEILKKERYEDFRFFPIEYILVRQDIACSDCPVIDHEKLLQIAQVTVKNNFFTLYRLTRYSPVVVARQSEFTMINPVKYRLRLFSLKDSRTIQLLLSFKKDWKIFPVPYTHSSCAHTLAFSHLQERQCLQDMKFLEGDELSYITKRAFAENTHKTYSGYANTWYIDPTALKKTYPTNYYKTNPDGSIDAEFVIYFKPQSWFYVTFIISLVTVLLAVYTILKIKK